MFRVGETTIFKDRGCPKTTRIEEKAREKTSAEKRQQMFEKRSILELQNGPEIGQNRVRKPTKNSLEKKDKKNELPGPGPAGRRHGFGQAGGGGSKDPGFFAGVLQNCSARRGSLPAVRAADLKASRHSADPL